MKKIAITLLIILMASCAEEVVKKPENLIPKEKMIQILHDLALLDAAKSSFRSTLKKNDIEAMEFLYKRYEIDSTQLAQSDLYYASIPLEYEAIYEEVDKLLDNRKKVLEDFTKRRNDSIREASQKEKDSSETNKKPTIKKSDPDS